MTWNNSSERESVTKNENARHSISKRAAPDHKDITALLDDLLHEDKYDRRLRPNVGGITEFFFKPRTAEVTELLRASFKYKFEARKSGLVAHEIREFL